MECSHRRDGRIWVLEEERFFGYGGTWSLRRDLPRLQSLDGHDSFLVPAYDQEEAGAVIRHTILH